MGPVVSAQALLMLARWKARRDVQHEPPANTVLVRPAFGSQGEAGGPDRPAGSTAPGHPRRGERA